MADTLYDFQDEKLREGAHVLEDNESEIADAIASALLSWDDNGWFAQRSPSERMKIARTEAQRVMGRLSRHRLSLMSARMSDYYEFGEDDA